MTSFARSTFGYWTYWSISQHLLNFEQFRVGHLLSIDVEPFAFVVFATHRDETFFFHTAKYSRD